MDIMVGCTCRFFDWIQKQIICDDQLDVELPHLRSVSKIDYQAS